MGIFFRKKLLKKVVKESDFNENKNLGWIKTPKKYRYNSMTNRNFIRLIKQMIKRF